MNDFFARFSGAPVLVNLDGETWLETKLTNSARMESAMDQISEKASSLSDESDFWDEELSWVRPYVVKEGILLIAVKGLLVNNFPYQLYDWFTGYDYLKQAYIRGLEDPEVKGIAFIVDSNGGEVAGNFDFVDYLYENRGKKPTAAIISEHSYSAAFSITSAVDPGQIYIPRTGGAGSVGVVTSHVDLSKYYEKMGISVKLYYAGKNKVDGSPYAPPSKEFSERIQARIDMLYGIFVGTVSRNLGLSEEAVRKTEASTFSAEEAVSIGFANHIMPSDKAFESFVGFVNQSQSGDDDMTTSDKKPSTEQQKTATEKELAEAADKGAAEAMERLNAILDSEQAKTHPVQAKHLAMKTKMSAEDAIALMDATPAEAQATPEKPSADSFEETLASAFNKAMGKGNPEVGADLDTGIDEEGKGEKVEDYLAAYQAATGRKLS